MPFAHDMGKDSPQGNSTPAFVTPHEEFCFRTAVKFTAVRGRGTARTRAEFKTYEEARASGNGDGRTMIYAINDLGNSAHITNV